jgi:hypothetical protein
MKVRRCRMIEKYSNDDAKYATDGWHENTEVK